VKNSPHFANLYFNSKNNFLKGRKLMIYQGKEIKTNPETIKIQDCEYDIFTSKFLFDQVILME